VILIIDADNDDDVVPTESITASPQSEAIFIFSALLHTSGSQTHHC